MFELPTVQTNMVQNKQTALEKRAKSKYISSQLARWLLFNNQNSPLSKSYRDSLYCCHELRITDGERLVGKYCKHRWCLTCNRIRMAVLMLGYGPQIRKLGDMWFVTLTARTVNRDELPTRIADFELAWRSIIKVGQKNKKLPKFIGLRKSECNPRPNDIYHYHFHILVQGEVAATWLVSKWLERWGSEADPKAQDVRKADDQSLLEVFKYQVKLPTKRKDGSGFLATSSQMDWIYQCLKGKRTFQPFGGLSMVSEEIDDDLIAQRIPEGLDGYIWRWYSHDWVSELGELLTGWVPTEHERNYLLPSDPIALNPP